MFVSQKKYQLVVNEARAAREDASSVRTQLLDLRLQEEKALVKEVTKVRIDQQVFDALARELPVPCVPKTELEAGVLLGVQMVLEKIRKGWVV